MHLFLLVLIISLLTFMPDAATSTTQSRDFTPISNNSSKAEHQKTTLFSRLGHKETGYGKSAFNFKHGLRSDDEEWLPVTHNHADLLYGSLCTNGDSDWFCVSMGGENPSKIKDLGALEWADIEAVPVLLATPPTTTGIRGPRDGESWEESSEQRVTKVVAGHMYVAHIKNEDTDLYAMFKVEELSPSDSCFITWKAVPSPEKEQNGR
jgi:hypothetical protein